MLKKKLNIENNLEMFFKILKLQRFIHRKKTLIFKNNQINFVKTKRKYMFFTFV